LRDDRTIIISDPEDTPRNRRYNKASAEPDYLLKIPVRNAIFTLAWPTMLAGLLENMATTVDMIMVGRLGSAEIASVGFSAMINWTMSSLSLGLSVAVTAVVARHIGAGKVGEAGQGLGQALSLTALLGLCVALITFVAAPGIFKLFGVEEEVLRLSVPYLRIITFAGVFFGIIFVSSGALRGAGDTRTPMYIGLAANVIHIGLNYILIFGKFGLPALGITGAAIGTMLSLLAASIIYLYLFLYGRVRLRLSWKDFRWNKVKALVIIRLALPAALEQFVLQFGLLIYVRFIVAFGTVALSGYQVGMQVLSLSFIPNTAFSIAAATLVGQNLGAARKEEAKRTVWICVFWGTVSMCVLGVLYLGFARSLAAIFIKDPEAINSAVSFIRVVAVCQMGMAIFFTMAGALRGAGDTRSPLLVTLLGMYGVRIPASWVFSEILGLGVGITFSLLILDYLVRVAAILFLYKRGRWLETEI